MPARGSSPTSTTPRRFDSSIQFGNATTLLRDNDDSALYPGSALKQSFPWETQDFAAILRGADDPDIFHHRRHIRGSGPGFFTDFIPGGAHYELLVSISAGLSGTPSGDVLNGGTGVDTMYGGAATILISSTTPPTTSTRPSPAPAAATVSSPRSRSALPDALLGAVENLAIVGSAVSAVGNALANSLSGNALANAWRRGGNVVLRGFGGNHTLSGGAHNTCSFSTLLSILLPMSTRSATSTC